LSSSYRDASHEQLAVFGTILFTIGGSVVRVFVVFLFNISAIAGQTDPLLGKWALDKNASQFEHHYEVIEDLGQKRFRISEGLKRNPEVTVFTADGTDQPSSTDRSINVIPKGNAWRVLWKFKDGDRDESIWQVSSDGTTLTQIGKYYSKRQNKAFEIHNVYKRQTGVSGLTGSWLLIDSVRPPGAFAGLEFKVWEQDGISIFSRQGDLIGSLKFNGKEYPDPQDPNASTSAIRLNTHTVEMDDRRDHKIFSKSKFTISPDNKSLTLTYYSPTDDVEARLVYKRVEALPSD
jgi:hypothetical protein